MAARRRDRDALWIDDDGQPCRVGFALGNEFSDHVLERQNYLYLAHSKLRPCAFGLSCCSASCRTTCAARSACCAARAGLAGAFCPARRTCRTRLPTSSITTSSTSCSAVRATCTCTSSAPPCSAVPPDQGRAGTTCSRSRPPRSGAAAQPARGRPRRGHGAGARALVLLAALPDPDKRC